MANTCVTEYVFEGEGKKINALRQELEKVASTKEECSESQGHYCKPNWIGFLAENVLGLDPTEVDDRGEFCIGETNNSPYDDNELTLCVSTYTDWSPCTELFEKVAEKFGVKTYWIAEELGCELFESNDFDERYFHDTYIIDSDEKGTEYFEKEEDVLKYVSKLTGRDNIKWDDLNHLEGITLYIVDYV